MNKEKTIFLITLISAIIILIIAASISVVLEQKKADKELTLNRSIFNKRGSGYSAWYKIAKDSGVQINVWKNSFKKLKDLKDENATMIIASPEQYDPTRYEYLFSETDTDELLNWVRLGNTLIYIDDFSRSVARNFIKKIDLSHSNTIDEDSHFENQFNQYEEEKTIYDTEHDLISFLSEEISSTSKARLKDKYIEPLISDEEGLVLGKRQYGKGAIYILTLPDIIDNSSLYEEEDNYQFFTNLVLAESGTVYINEYVHGFVKNEGLMTYYGKTLLNPISKQILLFLVILIWSVSRRFGKVIPVKDPDRRTNLEYVEAMGNLYLLSGLTGTALRPIYNQFRLKLCKELRADVKISDEDLANLIKEHFSNVQATELINLINEAKYTIQSNKISKDDMVEMCQKLNKYRLKGSKYAKRS